MISIVGRVMLLALVGLVCMGNASVRAESLMNFIYKIEETGIDIDVLVDVDSKLGLNKEQLDILYGVSIKTKDIIVEFLKALTEKFRKKSINKEAKKFNQRSLDIKEQFCERISMAGFSEKQLESTFKRNFDFLIETISKYMDDTYPLYEDLSADKRFSTSKFSFSVSKLIEVIFWLLPLNSETFLFGSKIGGYDVEALIRDQCKKIKDQNGGNAVNQIKFNLMYLRDAFTKQCA